MVQSLLCPFTMGQAMNNWNRYWKVVLSSSSGGSGVAKKRYNKYMERIHEEVAKAQREEEEKEKEESKRRKLMGLEGEKLGGNSVVRSGEL